MPLTFRVDEENRLVFAVASGTLTIDDLYRYQMDMWTSIELREYNELIDLTSVDAFVPPTADHIRDFSDFATSMEVNSSPSKLAIVAEGDFEFGLARMFQVFRETHPQSKKEVAVFRSVPEAMKYLKTKAS